MQKAPGILLLFFLFPLVLSGQSPATVDKIKFADTAGAKYYNLINQGLVSFSCNLKVDWDTVPKVLLVPAEIAGRQGLESTRIKVSQDLRSTAKVEHEYPQGTLAPAKVVYDPFLGWLQDVVRGFMMTWSAKGLGGPIPTEGNIDHVTREPTGYRIVLVNPRIQILANRDYLVTDILTSQPGDEIIEHPVFISSAQGLLFSGVQAVEKQGENETRIKYDVDHQTVDSLLLPHNVHLKVNDNMDMKFSFESCSVVRGTVLKVSAPPAR